MRTDSALKKNKTVRASIPYAQCARIGIIFTVEDKQKHQDVKDFIQRLQYDGKQVKVLEFLPDKKENYEFKFDFFTIQELSFWGNLNSEVAIKFANETFDYLFCVDRAPNPLVLHLLARSKAHCRVGKFIDSERDFFEMMIEHTGSNRDLINNMYNYTIKLH